MPDVTDLLSANPIGAAVQGGLGLAQTIVGLVNASKAKKEAAELQRNRPKYRVSSLAGEDLSLAESELSKGLSSRAENAYKSQQDKALSSSLDAILRSGGSVNNVADVFGASEEGRQRLAILQDNLRLNQINNVFKARANMLEQTDKAFLYNEDAPFKDRAAAVGLARKGANDMVWSGLNSVGAGIINFANQSDSERSLRDGTSNNGGSNSGGYTPHGNNNNGSTGGNSGMSHRNAPPPIDDFSNFQLPDYLNDPLWKEGGHNMFGGQ